jgi:hypothetical protein
LVDDKLIEALMKKILFTLVVFSVILSGCRKEQEKDKPLSEYIVGDWSMVKLITTADIVSPFVNGRYEATGSDFSGKWTFASDGKVTANLNYKITLRIAGNLVEENEPVNESFSGTYRVLSDSEIEITISGESPITVRVRNRENKSFELIFTDEIDEFDVPTVFTTVLGFQR